MMKALLILLFTASSLVAGEQIRVATYNASLAQGFKGQLASILNNTTNLNVKRVAEIIQIIAPDILLINEFDYDANNFALDRFHTNYLNISQNSQTPQTYPYRYTAPSNTGMHSGYDLDNNNVIDNTPGDEAYGNDALGFGEFEGKYGMAVYSKFPIDTANIRTLRTFLWKDMPNNIIPPGYYSPDELDVLPLSSKSHWDVPININGKILNFLVSHPTPPTFDGAEDKNGRRNHDEIRLRADYLSSKTSTYIYDDNGVFGGLAPLSRFVIAGDQNADPTRGDSVAQAINQILNHPLVDSSVTPLRPNNSDLTATFNLRVDYVLPSKIGFINKGGAVFWPTTGMTGATAIATSDHRPVYMDLELLPIIETAVRNLKATTNGTNINITWNTEPSVIYGLETSPDLTTWTPDETNTIQLDTETALAIFPNSSAPKFVRVTARYE
jgi:hypothetical protein